MADEHAPLVQLVNGAEIPRLGLGTSPMSNDQAEVAVATAIELGYRLFDTAHNYRNEEGVGKGIRAGGLNREEVFVTTKLNAQWHGYKEAQDAFELSAHHLGLDYIDLFLIHWPNPSHDRYVDAWKGLVQLLQDGRVRAIGTSNFKPAHIERLLKETGVTPDVNQIELNPALTRPTTRSYDSEHAIVTQSWSPLGKGGDLLVEPTIAQLADLYQRTPAQIVLRWHMQLGLVAIPRSTHRGRMRENLALFDFELTTAEIEHISALDRGESFAVDSDVFGH